MPNRSHFNSAHRTMNFLKKVGENHSSHIDYTIPDKTYHAIYIEDSIKFLKKVDDSSIQLVLVDPPYNVDLAEWDNFEDYLDWATLWLNEIERILSPTGNFIIFGGFQYQDVKKGDLLEIMHYLRHETNLRFINLIIWYYKNGMSAHRFFANRHEEILWYAKTKKYYFDLDSVRIPYDLKTKKIYSRDTRLRPESIEKGKNPTNVWQINRLNANSKERVGHPTQKPLEIIQRLVKSLSYPGSLVLDFFAGSGTTGRVCIDEKRHSILVDNDLETKSYFEKHLINKNIKNFSNDYEIFYNPSYKSFIDNFQKEE